MNVLRMTVAGIAAVCLAGCATSPQANGFNPQQLVQPQSTEPPPGNGPQFAGDGVVKVAYADFNHSAFPYRGMVPPDDEHSKPRPFLDVNDNGRLAHSSQRGGVLYEDKTFSDRRVLIAASKDFDPNSPAALIVLFHGNQGILARDVVARQQAPRQVAQSSLNAVLLAPQLAVDANDSSAGNFWRPGGFAEFLNEADAKLAELYPQVSRATFQNMPVIIVAYSGGYLPAAYSLEHGGADDRVRGVVLMDALFGEGDKFARWIERDSGRAFFISAYSASTREQNFALASTLRHDGVNTVSGLPDSLHSGVVAFVDATSASHDDFLTAAWTRDPLNDVLSRMGR